MWPWIKCKDAAASILARQDRRLSPTEAVTLQLHLLVCKACPEFEQQMQTMRRVMKAWQANDPHGAGTPPPQDN